ncbi:hypothetical protein ElyMa_001062000 [Elysia marginata]|uniref:Uncharacterized protein n=1 Tax=Elysia marginata TaxID=1093978 RepID=A0AAV4HPD0_9GAST|nr:hypothetical protein ElyMa_001062000 [Elysia marginata]
MWCGDHRDEDHINYIDHHLSVSSTLLFHTLLCSLFPLIVSNRERRVHSSRPPSLEHAAPPINLHHVLPRVRLNKLLDIKHHTGSDAIHLRHHHHYHHHEHQQHHNNLRHYGLYATTWPGNVEMLCGERSQREMDNPRIEDMKAKRLSAPINQQTIVCPQGKSAWSPRFKSHHWETEGTLNLMECCPGGGTVTGNGDFTSVS